MATLSPKTPQKPQFWDDFAAELDIFDSPFEFPAWIFDFRDGLIRKVSPELKRICRWLKGTNLEFKIKWPIAIDEKWKFADVYFPQQRTVLMVTNVMALGSRPCWMLSERAEFFKGRFRVIEVETVTELERKIQLLRETPARQN